MNEQTKGLVAVGVLIGIIAGVFGLYLLLSGGKGLDTTRDVAERGFGAVEAVGVARATGQNPVVVEPVVVSVGTGTGSPGIIERIVQGTQEVLGGLVHNVREIFGAGVAFDNDGDTYIDSTADDSLSVFVNGATQLTMTEGLSTFDSNVKANVYRVATGLTLDQATHTLTKAQIQEATYFQLDLSSNSVAVALPVLNDADAGRRLTFGVDTAGAGNAFTITGTALTDFDSSSTNLGTTIEDQGDSVDCIYIMRDVANCIFRAED